jgi:hypothetical protein
MFTRFRKTAHRLQVSLVETQRSGGTVRHGHVASLGSIGISPTPASRIAFWTKLHQRLATLANRIDSQSRGRVLAAVHARIPMPTPDDQRAVQLENAKADACFWATISDAQADQITSLKGIAASAAQRAAKRERATSDAADRARQAAERLARVERGEDVGSIGKPMTRSDLIKALGLKPADLRDCIRVAEIGEGGHDDLMAEIIKRQEQATRAASRAVLKRRVRA